MFFLPMVVIFCAIFIGEIIWWHKLKKYKEELTNRIQSDFKKNYYEKEKTSIDRHLDDYEIAMLSQIETNIALRRQAETKQLDNELLNYRAVIDKDKKALQNELDVNERQVAEKILSLADLTAQQNAIVKIMLADDQEANEASFHMLDIPQSCREDILILTKEVLPLLQHKDVLYKLIWSEFIQKPTTELMKRIITGGTSGIYKITNVQNGKCYIGKSVNLRDRLIDHIKSSLGISTIADQKVHRVMRDEGLWNFRFDIVEIVDKDKLSEREKFYIEFFQSDKIGYNQRGG